jgi:hypothetical protein
MAEFLVAPPAPVSWTASAEHFAGVVATCWSTAKVLGWPDGAQLSASAWIRAENAWDDIVLELHPNGYTIGIDSRSYPAVAEIACWWRGIVPPDIPVLWLFDRGFAGYSLLRIDTTPEQVFGTRSAEVSSPHAPAAGPDERAHGDREEGEGRERAEDRGRDREQRHAGGWRP